MGEKTQAFHEAAKANPGKTAAASATLAAALATALPLLVQYMQAGQDAAHESTAAHIITLGRELERSETERQECQAALLLCVKGIDP